MEAFSLHPTLVADCHILGTWRDIHVLLHRDAHVRWFILVPETSATEWHDLPAPSRDSLVTASSALSAMLRSAEACDKVNIAAIGNMVPQFHFHVIGRWKTDPYWPGVVWGRGISGNEYEEEELGRLRRGVLNVMG